MSIRDIHNVQQALNIAILANLPMTCIKDPPRVELFQFERDIPVNLNLDGVPA